MIKISKDSTRNSKSNQVCYRNEVVWTQKSWRMWRIISGIKLIWLFSTIAWKYDCNVCKN